MKKIGLVFLLVLFSVGCGTQNENLAKGKELIKSDKRRKEERAVREFKLALQQPMDNAEAHYLLGFYNSQEFYEPNTPDWESASIAERGKQMFLAYQEEKGKYLERLVFETLRDDDLDIQNAALDALKRVYKQADRKRLLSQLQKAIKSSDNRDRHNAHWVLGHLGKDDPNTIVPILVKLLEHGRTETRLNAVKALGEVGSEDAIPALAVIIESGSAKWERDREEPEVRQLAVEALGKIGGAAVPELVKIVENKGSSLRVDAIRALAVLGDEKVVEPLLDALKEQSSRDVTIPLN
ncbi:HEAT repeat domain-containing protein [Candidatus Poribacteria bacterium]|nr:HEAT repeat domain-containing protein [Candidatus Poribacteria bacterium]MYG05279.1 HEAT repeat domain-containing protein [Candidatus Poribacteria bacterium]MYK22392.1 HEAT repeat domain-containing protein [Candidatus Poribacteria bacterium]